MAKQQKRHVETYVESMQSHIHIHKNLQRAMLRTWRKKASAHPNRRQNTNRNPNTTQTANRLVQHYKIPHPEKEKTVHKSIPANC